MIRLTDITLSRGAKTLLEHASAAINPGEHIGLIGNNGCGKSSLFHLIRGEIEPDHGSISLPPDWLISSVRQETPSLAESAIDYVLDGHHYYRAAQQLLKAAEASNDGMALARAHEAFANADGYALPAKAAELLVGLGFPLADHKKPVKDFSGGWRMRLNLAQALIAPADLLLLDEPTNHLDLDAIIWLQDFLVSYPGTMLIISHDRDFLDALCHGIFHIENKQLKTYSGNYSTFERTRAEQRMQESASYQKELARKTHLEAYVARFRAKATKARQAQSRLKALEKMTLEAPPPEAESYHMQFPEAESYPQNLLRLKNAEIGYPDHPIFHQLNFSLEGDARIGLLGRNGAGKSTFIKALAASSTLLSGERITHPNIRIGYFTQHQLDRLRAEETPLWHLQQVVPEMTTQQQRNFIGGFGFGGERAEETIANFSGGEKARLALALIIVQRPNLLLLDEPTNHLDMAMRESLTRALQEYRGAMVIISHDRHLLRATCDAFYLVEAQTISPFEGDLEDYRAHLHAQSKAAQRAPTTPAAPAESDVYAERERTKKRQAEIRNELRPLKKALDSAETAMNKAAARCAELETALADSTLYQEENKDQLKTLLAQKQAADSASEAAENEWMQCAEAYEAAQARLEKITTS